MYDLKGKVAIVTGSARKRGLGRAIALRLADEGASVVVQGRPRTAESFPDWEKAEGWKGLDSLVEEIEAKGRKGLAVTGDISVEKEVDQMVGKAIKKFGHVDILVNNAAFRSQLARHSILDMPMDLWNGYMSVQLWGTLLMSRTVVKNIIGKGGKGGKIINMSSGAGRKMSKDNSHYCVSKLGIIGLTQCMALEWAEHQINVNVICPGSFPTLSAQSRGQVIQDLMHQGLSEEEAIAKHYEADFRRIPLGRLGKPEEIAAMVAFLASNQSDYITGEIISVDGGAIMV